VKKKKASSAKDSKNDVVESEKRAPPRKEQVIFDDLAVLCASPGYVHAIAYFCFRDTLVPVGDELTADDFAPLYSHERLIRTELSTLVGLMVRQPIDFSRPSPRTLQTYIDRTEELLKELHDALSQAYLEGFLAADKTADKPDFLHQGEVLRESIFYGGESAFGSQYRDLAVAKYRADNDWLENARGFSIETAARVISELEILQRRKRTETTENFKVTHPDEWTYLPAFTFTAEELSKSSGIELGFVDAVLSAFSFPKNDRNDAFTSMHDFNVVNATPIIQRNDREFVLFQEYSIAQALYETPFFLACW
jgi:hypothetical protein